MSTIKLKSTAFTTTASLNFIEELCRIRKIDLKFAEGYGDKIIAYNDISTYKFELFANDAEAIEDYNFNLVARILELIHILEWQIEVRVKPELVNLIFKLDETDRPDLINVTKLDVSELNNN